MAGPKVAVDFDKIIQTDRTRRKNEALADDIFNRGRRQSAPGAVPRKPGTGPSLASRVGISKERSRSITPKPIGSAKFPKRTVPAGNVNSDWTHDLHGVNNPSPLAPSSLKNKSLKPGRNAQFRTLLGNSASSPNLNAQFNVLPKAGGAGLSIRGIAGPTTVQAQNFAPGTTAADIESAMTPIGGKIVKCIVVATRPNVIAEIIFEHREGANAIIDTFHNQTADGRVLNLFIKPDVAPTPKSAAPAAAPTGPAIPVGPRADRNNARSTRPGEADRYNQRNRDNRNDVVDGSYGFGDDRMDTDEYDAKPLYSDTMVGGRGYNNRGGGRGGARGRGYR
ncbi:hypothetical protein V494_06635 [Pseudogymnoascus sp. VKM F-4513 (FW-928)]|nr:hypothetical protein V494_06635 [Pseudogymnoascus sp. VKM F-4513 (FW-928)]